MVRSIEKKEGPVSSVIPGRYEIKQQPKALFFLLLLL